MEPNINFWVCKTCEKTIKNKDDLLIHNEHDFVKKNLRVDQVKKRLQNENNFHKDLFEFTISGDSFPLKLESTFQGIFFEFFVGEHYPLNLHNTQMFMSGKEVPLFRIKWSPANFLSNLILEILNNGIEIFIED